MFTCLHIYIFTHVLKEWLTHVYVHEPARDVPVTGVYDVVVCGGGPAGVCAAIAAAEQGAKTLLIEGGGSLGGIWTSGQLCVLLDATGKGGLMQRIEDRLHARDAILIKNKRAKYTYDVEAMKYVLDTLCQEAGVDVLLYTRVVAAVREGDRITSVITEGYGGRQAFHAKAFVEATGNGQFAAQAGCAFDVGHPKTGKTQPATLIGIISGAPADEPGTRSTDEKLAFRDLLESVGFKSSYRRPSLWRLPNPELCCISVHHAYDVPCDDPEIITKATIEGRRELNQAVDALRQLPQWKNVRLVSTAEHLGIREGRRIHGLYHITVDDVQNGARFDDGICLVRFGVDIHALSLAEDNQDEPYHQGIRVRPYNIPLRSLIARDVSNLALAGRCVSGDFYAHASYRVTGNSVPMGEAAGIAAAFGAEQGVSLAEVDARRVRTMMVERGYEV